MNQQGGFSHGSVVVVIIALRCMASQPWHARSIACDLFNEGVSVSIYDL